MPVRQRISRYCAPRLEHSSLVWSCQLGRVDRGIPSSEVSVPVGGNRPHLWSAPLEFLDKEKTILYLMMAAAVTDLEGGLQAMLNLKPPGVSGSRITSLTSLCVSNIQVILFNVFFSIFVLAFRKGRHRSAADVPSRHNTSF